MHKSMSYKDKAGRPINNERLEFLGDAVLDAVVGDIVFNRFPTRQEGFLTTTRSKIVSRSSLNDIANKLHLHDFMRYQGIGSAYRISGNAFEALVGAIYLDYGFYVCREFMEKQILNKYVNLDDIALNDTNFKSKLIELSQHNGFKLDFVMLRHEFKDNNDTYFKSQVLIEGDPYGIGTGRSKRDSQQDAAKVTLELFQKAPHLLDHIKETVHGKKSMVADVCEAE